MPRIGNVEVSDDVIASLGRAQGVSGVPAGRPGIGAVLGGAAQAAYGQVRYGLPYQAAKLTGTLTPGAEAEYQRGLAEASAASAAAPAASFGDLTSGRVGLTRFIGENLATSLPSMAGAIGGGILGGLRGGAPGAAIGAIAGGIPQFSASNVARAVEEKGALTEAAATRALAVAPVQSAADAAIARFLPGAGKVLGDMAATQTGGFLRRTAKSMLEAAGTEAVTEAAQQIGERYAAGLTLNDADAAGEYVNAAATAFVLGGVLGAGGGFRRTNAVAKPAEMVTQDDISEHINGVLDGTLKALPSPEMVGRTAQGPQLEEGSSAPIEMPNPTDFQVDSQGRVAPTGLEGDRALAIEQNLPQAPGPTDAELLARVQQNLAQPDVPAALAATVPAAFDGTFTPPATATSVPALTGTQPTAANPVPAPEFARPLQGVDLADLNKARKAKNADPAVVAQIETELEARKAEDPFNGVPMNQDIAKLRNATPEEQVAGVRTLLENGDDRAGTMRLAERLGIDLNAPEAAPDAATVVEQAQTAGVAEPAPLADPRDEQNYQALLADEPNLTREDFARRKAGGMAFARQMLSGNIDPTGAVAPTPETLAAAANAEAPVVPRMATQPTVDPGFEAQWQKLKNEAGIQRMRSGQDTLAATPANLEQAQAQVFQALASDSSNAEVSQVEKMARKMGLVTDDDAMDVTPTGRRAFLSTPQGFEETVLAARQQGYEGAQASIFDRGVRAALAGESTTPTFANFDDMAAYQAGQVWSQDFVENAETRTAAQTDAIRARQEGRATGTAVPRERARIELSPQQVQQASLNRLVDAADLRGVGDTDVAALRRMVRDGASPDDLGRAIQAVQQGGSLFREAPREGSTLIGARPTRGGQPRYQELRNDPTLSRAAGVLDSKGGMRAETEVAVQAYDLRQRIAQAVAAEKITQARANKLNAMLDKGQVGAVQNITKGLEPKTSALQDRRETDRGVSQASLQLEQAIDGRTFAQVVDHLVEEAPSTYHREIMRGVKGLADKLTRAGARFDFKLVRPGDEVPDTLLRDGVKAISQTTKVPPQTTVYVKNSEMGTDGGVSYEIIAHEMIHAVTQLATDFYEGRTLEPNDKLGRAVADLHDLANTVINHFNASIASENARSPAEKRWLRPVLTPLEKQFNEMRTNAFANADEVLAWGLTNPDMQRYLSTIQYKPKQSVFGRLAELVRKLLQIGDKGVEVRHDSALIELMRVSEQIFSASQRDLTLMMVRNRGADMGVLSASLENAGAANRNPAVANETTQTIAARAAEAVDKLNLRDLGVKARRTALGWLSHNQIDRQYGEQIPAAIEHSDAHRERVAIRSRFEQMGEDAYQAFEQLEKANPKAAERVGQVMATTTEFQIDPEKTWEQHTWLADNPDAVTLKRLHGDAVKIANDLKRGDGAGWAAYRNFRHLNEAQNFSRMAVGLHGLVATDPELAMGIENSWANPADAFMRSQGLGDPAAIRDWWAQALDAQIAAATAFVRDKKGEAERGGAAELRTMTQHLSPIEMQISAIHEAKAAMDKSPYFHLGRFGDNFGSAVIGKNADGTVDAAKQQKVAQALEKAGFTDAQISADNTKPRFMLRFDTVDQAVRFRQVALDLQRQGLLDPDGEIKVGPRQQANNFGTAEGLPQFVSAYIQNLEASPMFSASETMTPNDRAALEKLKQDTIQLARDTWIESQPDSSISKVLAKRNTIPGYNKDMIRNFAHRWRVGSINIANVASAPKFNRAFTNMQAQYNDALVANRRGPDGEPLAPSDPFTVQDVMSELKMRDARSPINETSDTFDKLRAYAHSYFLGFSPAYALINTTQLGVTALPELAKKHGYSSSFHAMRRASVQAFAIVKAAGAEARKLGPQHWGDVAITENVLKNAGLDENTRDFMRNMLATGTIDIGSMARSLGQVADNKGVGGLSDRYLKWSSSLGLYTETFSRLVTALAARDLNGGYGPEAQAYAAKAVSESMFDYQTWNTARQMGKKGFLGPVTPLLTQFMSYQAQITEKLYSETLDAFAKPRPGESAEAAKERKTEARRFLMGHLAAVTTLAGTMGLPFATVFATVIERLVDAFDDDDEPFDATVAYRNFLSSVLGKDVGEVLSRGAPRALGFDISSRAGEQNLLPFSEFLADRRSWKEAVGATAGRSLGAVPSMIQNVLDGGSQMANGDVLGGMKSMLPVAFKSPIETYRMSEEGYVDSKGNKLPMSPTASAYVWQLLGFSPSAKAEYGEVRGDQAARRGEITRQASTLRQGIVRALRTGDQDTARELIADAIKFDQDNPAFAVIPSITSSLERQTRAASQSRALNTPTGVSLRDIAGQDQSQYANF